MGSSYRWRGIFLIPASYKESVNSAIASSLDTVGGAQTFTLGASSEGSAPATHYYASSLLTQRGVIGVRDLSQLFPDTKAWIWTVRDDTFDTYQTLLESLLLGVPQVTLSETNINEVLSANNLQRLS